MSQSKVTEYYRSRKRTADFHASKRRKVLKTDDVLDGSTTETKEVSVKGITISAPREQVVENSRRKKKQQREQVKKTNGRPRARQKQIPSHDALSADCRSTPQVNTQLSNCTILKQTKLSTPHTQDVLDSVISETSAVCDDHQDSPLCTPQKQKTENLPVTRASRKRTKPTSALRKDLFQDSLIKTPEKGYDFTEFVKRENERSNSVARKRLILKNTIHGSSENKQQADSNDKDSKQAHSTVFTTSAGFTGSMKDAEKNVSLGDSNESKTVSESINGQSATSNKGTTQLKGNMDTLKMKEKLMKCGKLSELKEKLSQFHDAVGKVKKIQQTKEESIVKQEESEKTPAHEKFHSLAVSVPPSLSLPFKYKVLKEMFHSMETVVSMLYNRTEICTFSKLKKAVQTMVHRNFELKTVGQIKTVHPDAYSFRQEKGLPRVGGRSSGYELTVEPVLEAKRSSKDEVSVTSTGRVLFTATHLLERRQFFNQCLVDIVKVHHREFLAKLTRPLSVPDDKITRWHPKFSLDEVPDVECAELPAAPDVKLFSTAKDVLNEARDRLPSRIQKALKNTSDKLEQNTSKPKSAEQEQSCTKTDSNSSALQGKNSSSLQGISQSLLEKIRAKEAQQLERKMMFDPKEEKRVLMMGRLVEFTRILRAIFVQEKKPALPMDYALKKLGDSCRSAISTGELEEHVKLMQQVLPDWISTVQVRQGKFLKIDRNRDMNAVTDKINAVIKQS